MTVSQERKEEQSLNLESVTWGDLTWVNIEQSTEREIDYLAKNYPFHPLDLDDCLSRIQRPKIDVYEDYLFLVLHLPVYNKKARVTTPSQVSVFIGENYLITLHKGELKPLVKLFQGCRVDEKLRQEYFSYGSGYLLYRLIDKLVDYLFPILDKILEAVDDVEGSVFDENVEATEELAILRRDVLAQRRAIWPLRSVIAGLESKLERFTKMDLKVYFGDLLDHVDKVWDTLEECKEIVEVFKDSDYVLGTERLNRVMRILTILSTIILPFLVVSSIYGMNIALPGGLERGSLQSFLIVLASMVVISGGMLYFFRRKRWI